MPKISASLWRDRNFLTLWGGQSLSQLGAQITQIAIPVLAVVMLQATELEVGVLNAMAVVAFLLLGLPAGAWIDRLRKRHVMIVADAVRAVALLVVPLLWFAGVLEVWHLFLVAFVTGVAMVFFDVSYQSIIPSLVQPGQIGDANGKLESTQQVAHIVGPAAGGWLLWILAAPVAFIVTAGTYLLSLVALLFIRDQEQVQPAHERKPIVREIGEGLRWVFGNVYLRRIVVTASVTNFFGTMTFTLLPLFLLRYLGFSAEGMGLILSLSAIGGLLGAALTPRIIHLVGEGPVIPLAALLFAVMGLFLPMVAWVPQLALPLLIAQGMAASFFILVWNITQVSFRQRITPKHLLGRMNASVRFVVWGVMPFASVLAGLLATWWGLVPVLWLAVIGELLATMFLVIGPFWGMRELPSERLVSAEV